MLEYLLSLCKSSKFYVPVITICVTIVIINLSSKVVKKLINKNSSNFEIKKRNTIVSLLENIIRYILVIIAVLIILSVWGINVSALITGLGIAGVVGGLAIQDALKDIIMGCNIIMDNYFIVGDLVTYDGFTGEVVEFGLKNTKIKAFDGTVLVVANRSISKIINLSQKDQAVFITVPTSYDETEENVAKVLNKVCKKVKNFEEATGEGTYLGVNELSESSVDYLIKVQCKAGDQYALKRKVLALVKHEFDSNGLKIPYKQIEVHNGKRV